MGSRATGFPRCFNEQAVYNGTDPADFREELTRRARHYGFGIEAPLSKNLNLRAEYGRIPHASVGAHFGDRNMTYGLLGLGAKF